MMLFNNIQNDRNKNNNNNNKERDRTNNKKSHLLDKDESSMFEYTAYPPAFEHPDDDDDVLPPVIVAASESIVDNPDFVDQLLVKEMTQMSMTDRNQVFQEIHGVADIIEETSDMVTTKLQELEEELQQCLLLVHNNNNNNRRNSTSTHHQQQHPPEHPPKPEEQQQQDWYGYQLACDQNPMYFTQIESTFRLAFLRSEKFHVEKAAKRIGRYFHEKLILFGIKNIAKPNITLQDLSQEDQMVLNSGYMNWLSERDRSGRAIFFAAVALCHAKEISNVIRAIWYFLYSAWFEDEETQKYGMITIVYLMGDISQSSSSSSSSSTTSTTTSSTRTNSKIALDRRTGYHTAKIFSAMPLRMEVLHICCDQVANFLAIKLIMMVSGQHARNRARFHLGSPQEVCYKLLSFGIPVNRIPITSSGEFDFGPLMAWMESRRRIDQLTDAISMNTSNDAPPSSSTTMQQELQQPQEKEERIGAKMLVASSNMSAVDSSTMCTTTSTPTPSINNNDNNNNIILLPRPQDVLFGNLKVTQTQQGNGILRSMIEEYQSLYEQATTKSEKMQISRTIMSQIQNSGGRFLKQTKRKYDKYGTLLLPKSELSSSSSIGWMEVKDQVARDKIGHAFRKLRQKKDYSHKSSNNNNSNSHQRGQHQHQHQHQQQPSDAYGSDGSGGDTDYSSSGCFGGKNCRMIGRW